MRDKIYEKVVEPRLDSHGALPVFPTTNVSESMNNRKKIENGRHPNKLPVLVHNGETTVDSYQSKCMTTLYGQGQWDLVPPLDKLKKTYEQWAGMNEGQKLNQFGKLNRGPPEPLSTQTSKCDVLTINRPVGLLLKPGSKRSATSERTRNIPKTPTVPRGRARSQNTSTPKTPQPRGRPRSQSPSKENTPKRPRGRPPGSKNKAKKQQDMVEPSLETHDLEQIQDANVLGQNRDSMDSNDAFVNMPAKRKTFDEMFSSDSEGSMSHSPSIISNPGPTLETTKPKGPPKAAKALEAAKAPRAPKAPKPKKQRFSLGVFSRLKSEEEKDEYMRQVGWL